MPKEDVQKILAADFAAEPQLALAHQIIRRSKLFSLGIGAKYFLSVLIDLAQQKGFAFCSNVYLAREFGISTRQVKKYIQELREKDLIYILITVTNGRRRRKIYIRYSTILTAQDEAFPEDDRAEADEDNDDIGDDDDDSGEAVTPTPVKAKPEDDDWNIPIPKRERYIKK